MTSDEVPKEDAAADPYVVSESEQAPAPSGSADSLSVRFSRGMNMYGNDRFAYEFTSANISKDWPIIVRYAKHFNSIIDQEIQKRTDIKNNQPKRPRGRPSTKTTAPPEETA